MPANRFNGYTDYGVGIGLRVPHYDHILSKKPVVDWFEIVSENYMVDGGRPLKILDQNHDFDPMDYVNSIPAERVAQIHIAGHSKFEKYILDTHDHPVLDTVWKLYERATERSGPTATLLEWDDNIPSFDEVHAEALKANRFLLAAETAMSRGVEVLEEAHA